MSFYNIIQQYNSFTFRQRDNFDIQSTLSSENLSWEDFWNLLSEQAGQYLEDMAQRAHQLTVKYFGRTIQLYTPLYLSNYCDNQCLYCGFQKDNQIIRKKLSLDQVDKEAEFLSEQGFQHILILTGSSRKQTPVSYVKECVLLLRQYFSSVSIEIYALTFQEYKELVDAGIDGVTIYQEVYDQNIYRKVHPKGPKSDYQFRLDAPSRAAQSNIRCVNIGALLGLGPWRKEVFLAGLHAKYLQDTYPHLEISISIPRLRPYAGQYDEVFQVTDKDIVQIVIALRLFLPRVGITLSTRESQFLRDHLLHLGITRISAGSTTAVGGHTSRFSESNQFEIADNRTLDEIKHLLNQKGYQPVLKDWLSQKL